MLSKVMLWLAKVAVGKHIVSVLAWLHNALDGHKSEAVLVVGGLVHGLKILNIVPPEAADSIEGVLMTLLPVALADRASKIKKSIDSVVP